MELIGSAPGDQLELSAAALAGAGELTADDTAELLHGIDRGVADDGAKAARLVVVDVKAVERNVRLVVARTGNRTEVRDTRQHVKQR